MRMSEHVGLPYTKGSATSKAAAKSMVEPSKNQRQRIWEYLEQQGKRGATYYEIKQVFKVDGPRMTELRRLGRVKETDETRLTPKGRQAKVYVVIPRADWTDQRAGWPTPRKRMKLKVSDYQQALAEMTEDRDEWKRLAEGYYQLYMDLKGDE